MKNYETKHGSKQIEVTFYHRTCTAREQGLTELHSKEASYFERMMKASDKVEVASYQVTYTE
jgi:hypothetical protein